MEKLTVATTTIPEIAKLDPKSVTVVNDYEIMHNVYGRLTKYSIDGSLEPDIPDSWEIDGPRIQFHFGRESKTATGTLITAADAAISLKRLVLAGGSGHGDIRNFLCGGTEIKSLKDSCSGIEVDGSKLILTANNDAEAIQLLNLLDSVDYSIIPSKCIDPVDGHLTDMRHQETSGPYYVKSQNLVDGSVELAANPNSYLYSESMAELVILKSYPSGGAHAALASGEIDVISSMLVSPKEIAASTLDSGNFEVHESVPMRVMMVVFSAKALAERTPAERYIAGQKAAETYAKFYGQYRGQPTHEIFGPLSDGGLSDEQQNELRSTFVGFDQPIKRAFTFAVLPHQHDNLARDLSDEPIVEVVRKSNHPLALPEEDRPDMFVVTADTSWHESLPMLGHYFNRGRFDYPGLDANRWMKKYIATVDKIERIRLLSELHLEVLKNVTVLPFEIAPYFSAARKDLSLNQYRLSARVDFWTIRKKLSIGY